MGPRQPGLLWDRGTHPKISFEGWRDERVLTVVLLMQMAICWRIQAFLMFLFGPCLLAGYIFLPKRLQAKQVRDIQFEFLVGSSVLSVSVLTATAIYLFSTDQPFEQTFLYHLATMQFFALFTVWSTFIPIYSRTDGRTGWYNIFYLIIAAAPFFLNFLITILFFISLHPAIPYFLIACIDNVDTGLPTSAPEYVIRAYKGDWIMTAQSTTSIITFALTSFSLPTAGLLLLFWRSFAWRCHQQLHMLITSGSTVAMVVFMVRMDLNRSMMRSLVGEDYIGDEWGFGQILAIFIWIPIIFRLVVFLSHQVFRYLSRFVTDTGASPQVSTHSGTESMLSIWSYT